MHSIIFSGQGAHYAGMGVALCQASPAARSLYQTASGCLGLDLLTLTADQLSQTRFAQPAIVAYSMACLAALREQVGSLPDEACLAGFSLGEYTALGASGILDIPNLLRLVQARADFMQQAAEQNPGAMAAVIGLDDEIIAALLAEPAWRGRVFAVNFNAPGQVVVSGEQAVMDDCLAACRASGARKTIPLDVSGAFHTPLMQPAADRLFTYARNLCFKATASCLYSNLSGARLPETVDWPDYLARHLCGPVLWTAEVRQMAKDGTTCFLEAGPGKVLCGLVRRILPGAVAQPLDLPDGLEPAGRLLTIG
ncbi:MAG: ACP S-malonyltransferase [Clostridiaceae bacterium]|nr:ACP S-malonyltransferase [Clostridiaceae bacterium]